MVERLGVEEATKRLEKVRARRQKQDDLLVEAIAVKKAADREVAKAKKVCQGILARRDPLRREEMELERYIGGRPVTVIGGGEPSDG